MKRKQRSPMLGKLGQRKTPTRDPKSRIFVYSEGDVTERLYFEGLARMVGNHLVEVEVVGGQGAPMTVVAAACTRKVELETVAQKSPDSFDNQFEVWIVIDVDEHPKLHQALRIAKEKGIGVALSNPCFEIWLLYHVEPCDAPMQRHKLQKYLAKKIKSYDHKAGKRVDFEEIQSGHTEALKRAHNGLKARSEEGKPNGNPSSSAVHLVERIISLGRYKK